MELIWKIGGIGIVIMVLNKILENGGQQDKAALVSFGGVVIIFLMIALKIQELFNLLKAVFHF